MKIEYKLVEALGPESLSKLVTNLLEEGWYVHGSPICTEINGTEYYYQAMMKQINLAIN